MKTGVRVAGWAVGVAVAIGALSGAGSILDGWSEPVVEASTLPALEAPTAPVEVVRVITAGTVADVRARLARFGAAVESVEVIGGTAVVTVTNPALALDVCRAAGIPARVGGPTSLAAATHPRYGDCRRAVP